MAIEDKKDHLVSLPRDIEIVVGRTPLVLKLCENKKVLHLGCVDEGITRERVEKGTLLHLQLLEVAKEVHGVDISKGGLKFLEDVGVSRLYHGNLETLDEISGLKGEVFDVILAAEVLEHLNNPGLFLQSVKPFFGEETLMVVTTPNAYRFTGTGYRLKNMEFIHPDHVCWHSWSTLNALLSKNGYEVKEAKLYSVVDHRSPLFGRLKRKMKRGKPVGKKGKKDLRQIDERSASRKRSLKSRGKMLADIMIRRVLYRISPFFADGFIFIVKPVGKRV